MTQSPKLKLNYSVQYVKFNFYENITVNVYENTTVKYQAISQILHIFTKKVSNLNGKSKFTLYYHNLLSKIERLYRTLLLG